MTFVRGTYTFIQAAPRTEAPPAPARGSRLFERLAFSRETWRQRALCKGLTVDNTSIWLKPHLYAAAEVQACLALCNKCPVFDECSKEGTPTGITAGVVWSHRPGYKPLRQLGRQCKWCREPFFGETPNAQFCNELCRARARRESERRASAKYVAKTTRPRANGDNRSANVTEAAQNGEKAGSAYDAPANSKEPSEATGGPLVMRLPDPLAPVKNPGAK